jgi:hypothetical protein
MRSRIGLPRRWNPRHFVPPWSTVPSEGRFPYGTTGSLLGCQ